MRSEASLAAAGPALQIDGLRAAYTKDAEILRGVDVSANPGSVTAIVGANGAGKSTLLKAVVGLVPVVGGSISIGGDDVTRSSARSLLARGVVLVPQERTTFPEMTVWENLHVGGWTRRRDRRWLAQRVDRIAELFPVLRERLTEPAGYLSGGQQKMLEIARALVIEPSVILLDEPTAGLAPAVASVVYEQIRLLRSYAHPTILLVDQNVREAIALADHVYVLTLGENDGDGAPREIEARLDDMVRGWMRKERS